MSGITKLRLTKQISSWFCLYFPQVFVSMILTVTKTLSPASRAVFERLHCHLFTFLSLGAFFLILLRALKVTVFSPRGSLNSSQQLVNSSILLSFKRWNPRWKNVIFPTTILTRTPPPLKRSIIRKTKFFNTRMTYHRTWRKSIGNKDTSIVR